ncbi:MAG TPA: hypothetical protein VHC69_27865 [Polyangiaceae bacterium]|nr:hypothetical protein [Polyangiaceae bacterium]
MAGQVRGKIECFLNEGNGNNNAQSLFKALYDFFTAHPKATLIARQAGAGRAAGDTGYYDSPTPFGDNAWFVVKLERTDGDVPAGPRAFDYYVLFQYASNGAGFNAAPGNPGLFVGSTSPLSAGKIGVSVAIGVGGDANPWNGAGASLGANTKGTPVWMVPAGGTQVHVLPRSNNAGGTHTTNRENMAAVMSQSFGSGPKARAHVVADDDSFLIAVDNDDDNTYQAVFVGLLTPRQGLALPHPLVMIADSGLLPWSMNSVFGDPAGTASQQGGGVHRDNTIGTRQLVMERLNILVNTSVLQPNRLFATPEFDEFPIACAINETPHHGFLGQVEFIREVGNIATHDTSADKLRCIIGSSTVPSVKLSIPWDGATTPKSGITRQGIDFVRAGP